MNLIYQVYIGKQSNLYDHCIESVSRYAKKHGFEHIVQREPILRILPDPKKSNRSKEASGRYGCLPIYEKENAFDLLDQYDKIAIIDSDIWIRESTPNIFQELGDYEFGAVLEREMPITDKYRNKITSYSKGQYGSLKDVDWDWQNGIAKFYNMGLMVFTKELKKYLNGQSALEFIRRPEFERFVNGEGRWKWSTDQTLLNWWIKKEGVKTIDLNWKWNALYRGIHDSKIKEAHFVHFFLKDHLPQKGENINQLMKVV